MDVNFFSLELELEVLSAAINEDNCFKALISMISTKDVFHYYMSKKMYYVLEKWGLEGFSPSTFAMISELKKDKSITDNDILSLKFNYSTLDFKQKCAELIDLYAKRFMIENCQAAINRIFSKSDPYNEKNELIKSFETIDKLISLTSMRAMKVIVPEVREEVNDLFNNQKEIGIRTGYKEYDKIGFGLQNSDLIIIAGRPGMGKTSLAMGIAQNVAEMGNAVGVFSLEMSEKQLTHRMICASSELIFQMVRSGKLSSSEKDRWDMFANDIEKLPIFIDDTGGVTTNEINAKAWKLKQENDVKLIIIDYLQLISGTGSKNRAEEVSKISRDLKLLAKNLNIPVVALAQLSRAVEMRGGDKRPILSDLKESGGIEENADVINFIYRPEYYGFLQDENGESTIGKSEVIFAKNRNGACASANLGFIPRFAKFHNIEKLEYSQPYKFIETNTSFDDETPF